MFQPGMDCLTGWRSEFIILGLGPGEFALFSKTAMPTMWKSSIIIRGSFTAETALRLSHYFGNSPQFWMNLQTRYEIATAEQAIGAKIRTEVERAA